MLDGNLGVSVIRSTFLVSDVVRSFHEEVTSGPVV